MPVSEISKQFKEYEKNEVLTKENNLRWVAFPIEYTRIWEMYKKQVATFWTPEEIDLSEDFKDWSQLKEGEQHFIKIVLAFFAAAGGMIAENLSANFTIELQLPEARAYYGYQLAMENQHSEVYAILMDNYIKDPAEKTKLISAILTVKTVEEKAAWLLKWMNRDDYCLAERLVAYACVETILMAGGFCSFSWLKKRGVMNGLTFGNGLVSRDEGMFSDFTCLVYSMLENRLPQSIVHEIVVSAVDVERRFVCENLPVELIGLKSDLMMGYVEAVADRLVEALGYEKIYNTNNHFEWMELKAKTQIFEKLPEKKTDAAADEGREIGEKFKAVDDDVDF